MIIKLMIQENQLNHENHVHNSNQANQANQANQGPIYQPRPSPGLCFQLWLQYH